MYRFSHARRIAEQRRISDVRCTDSHAARGAAIASLFDRCSLTVSTCRPPPMEKFRRSAAPVSNRTPPSSSKIVGLPTYVIVTYMGAIYTWIMSMDVERFAESADFYSCSGAKRKKPKPPMQTSESGHPNKSVWRCGGEEVV